MNSDEIEDVYPLTPLQEGMLYYSAHHADSSVYYQQFALTYRGPVDAQALHAAWRTVVGRHAALRTSVHWERLDQPVQVVHARAELEMPVLDWTDLGEDAWAAADRELRERDRQTGFDLLRAPLLSVRLIRLSGGRWRMHVAIHHLVIDGWSFAVVAREVTEAYRELRAGREPRFAEPVPFRGYVDRLGEREVRDAEGFWRGELAGFTRPVDILRGRRPGLDAVGEEQHHCERTLAAGATAALLEALRARRTTLGSVQQAAWALLLSRYSGRDDVVFGSSDSGRAVELPGVEDMVGLCVNTLPTRVRVRDEQSAGDFLRQVQAGAAAAREHAHLPLTRVQAWSEVPAGTELFDTIQTVQNFERAGAVSLAHALWDRIDGAELVGHDHFVRTNYPLTLTSLPGERIVLRVSYAPSWLTDAAAGQLLADLETLMTGLVADPDRPLGAIALVDGDRAERLRALSPLRTAATEPLHRRVERWAAETPDAPAAAHGERVLTYADLDDRAARLATVLTERGLRRGAVVPVQTGDPLHRLTATLAVGKAGGVVLVADPATGAGDDLRALATGARLAVTDAATGEPLARAGVDLDAAATDIDTAEPLAPGPPPEPSAAAHVVLPATPGGAAVLVDHRAASAAADSWQELAAVRPGDRVLHFAPPGGAASAAQTHLALAAGACLCLPEREDTPAEDRFTGTARRHGVTHAVLPAALVDALPADAAPGSLHTLVATGRRIADATARRNPAGRRLLVVDGADETAGLGTVTEHTADGAATRPTPFTAARVLDAAGRPLPAGVAGELWTGGPHLARGHVGRPGRTAEVFRADPLEHTASARLYRTGSTARWTAGGTLEILGGGTTLVTRDGTLVDPEAVAAVLRSGAGVERAVVVQHGEGAAAVLTGYVVPGAGPAADAPGLADEQVNRWQELYDHTYRATPQDAEAEFNTIGWNNSYDGGELPAEEMREWLGNTLERITALRPQRVLEIGCGTGMLLLPLCRRAEEYWGTDLSPAALEYVAQQLDSGDYPPVKLLQRGADQLGDLPEGHFDTIVVNSVVQYFPSGRYLREVLTGLLRLLRPGGHLFAGDIRDLGLLREMHLSIALAAAGPDPDPAAALAEGDRTAAAEGELLAHPDFFHRLAADAPVPCTAFTRIKQGAADNELTRFRYDAVLTRSDGDAAAAPEPLVLDAAATPPAEAAAEAARLLAAAPAALLVRGVPHTRVAAVHRLLADVTAGQEPAPALTAEVLGGADPAHPLAPDTLAALGAAAGYRTDLVHDGRTATLAALFTPEGTGAAARAAVAGLHPLPAARLAPWDALTNDPLAERRSTLLRAGLQAELESRLDAAEVPGALLVLDRLPLTPHGEIDHTALPLPAQETGDRPGGFVPPRDATELVVARVWEDVLGVGPVGATDDFFALGGHSLVAMRIVSRLQRRFDRPLDLAALLSSPTVERLAALLRDGGQEAQGTSCVALQPDGEGTPLFLVHPAGGNNLIYAELVDALGTDHPAYVLEEPDPGRWTSIEDLVRPMLATVRCVQPEGPYRIAGLSFGGMVAHELARQLTEEHGERVEFVALLDTPIPAVLPEDTDETVLWARRTMRLKHALETLFGREVPLEESALAGAGQARQLELLTRAAEGIGLFDGDIGSGIIDRIVRSMSPIAPLMRAYTPRPLDVPLWLFRSSEPMPADARDPEFDRDDPALGWDGPLGARLTVVPVPGTHLTMLSPPHVATLAGHFARMTAALETEEAR